MKYAKIEPYLEHRIMSSGNFVGVNLTSLLMYMFRCSAILQTSQAIFCTNSVLPCGCANWKHAHHEHATWQAMRSCSQLGVDNVESSCPNIFVFGLMLQVDFGEMCRKPMWSHNNLECFKQNLQAYRSYSAGMYFI